MSSSDGEAGAAVGEFVRRFTNTPNGMGSWTGLPPLMGAPVSGALLGAGAGALYGGYKKLTEDPRNPEPRKALLKKTLLGALAGGGVGLISGGLQTTNLYKQQSFYGPQAPSPQAVLETLHNDRYLSYADKQNILQALSKASPSQWSTLMTMAAGGALTGAAASKILGVGLVGATLAAGAGALIFRNLFGQPTIFV